MRKSTRFQRHIRSMAAALVAALSLAGEACAGGQWLGNPCGGPFPMAAYSWWDTNCWSANTLPGAGSDILLVIGVQPDVTIVFRDSPVVSVNYGNLRIANRDTANPLQFVQTSSTMNFSNVDIATVAGEGGALILGGTSVPLAPVGSGRMKVSGTVTVGTGAGSVGRLRIDTDGYSMQTANLVVGGGSNALGQLTLRAGSLTVTDSMTLNRAGFLFSGGTLNAPNSWTNGGTVIMTGGTIAAANAAQASGTTLTNNAQFQFEGGQMVHTSIINNAGGSNGSLLLKADLQLDSLVNNSSGVVGSNEYSPTLTVVGKITNSGRLSAGASGAIKAGSLLNNAGGELSSNITVTGLAENKGHLVVNSIGTSRFAGGLVNTGRMEINGFGNVTGGTMDNRSGGVVWGGDSFIANAFINRSGATLQVGSTGLTFEGSFTAEAGSTIAIDGLRPGGSAVNLTLKGPAKFARGTHVTGAFGVVNLAGAVDITGAAGGAVQFDGAAQLYGATVTLDVGSASFDQLAGQVLFINPDTSEKLVLQTTGGYVAQAGQSFQLLSFGKIYNQFDAIDTGSFAVASGARLDLSQLYTSGTVNVVAVPEPATWLTLCAGLALLVRRRALRRGMPASRL